MVQLYPGYGSIEKLPGFGGQHGFVSLDFPPQTSASSVIVGDAETGRIIYQKNADEIRPIASLTKIMTAILVLEKGDLSEIVSIPKDFHRPYSWVMGLKPAQKIVMRDLLLAFLIESRNDAALAAAQAVGGTEQGFVEMMNQKAKSIGANMTLYSNSHGLNTGGFNLSTASDIFRMTMYAISNPKFRDIVNRKDAEITLIGKSAKTKYLHNVNKMLFLYEGVDGVKTGYTKAAGKCIALSAKKGNRHVICVILNSKNIWKESQQMLDYGFARVSSIKYGDDYRQDLGNF